MWHKDAMELGILVGGRSTRMGRPKGRLPSPFGGTLLERLVDETRAAGLVPWLVGDANPYEGLVPDVPRRPDAPSIAGPLAGLVALLEAGGSGRHRIAIACDMPFVDRHTLIALARDPSTAPVLAARRGEGAPWEPWLARYDLDAVKMPLAEAVARGERSPQRFFATLPVARFEPPDPRALDDWDVPDDIKTD